MQFFVVNKNYKKNRWMQSFCLCILFTTLLSDNIKITIASFSSGSSCDKTRKVLTESNGEISDGINANYTQDSHCEWLIKAQNKSQFITLKFNSIRTECSYDYVFVYDGNSYRSRLLGSFSGKSERIDNIIATSGYMLILLYSDTNYVMDGFKAEYSIFNCPNNCSNQGICLNHTCICSENWTGKDCSYLPCPDDCGKSEERGICNKNICECSKEYSGRDCSLHKFKPISNKWHWLSDRMDGFVARASHTAVYNELTDSLYVFGGHDLNKVLDILQIYRFKTSSWEDENETKLKSEYEEIDPSFLTSALHETESKYLGIESRASFLRNLLFTYPSVNSASESTENHNYTTKLSESSPAARYSHAAVALKDGFVIFGGILGNNSFSNDLWSYNISTKIKWKLRARFSKFYPPKLARHSITLVNDTIYLFGGSLEDGKFSSRLYKIKLSNNESEEQWKEVIPHGGKSLDIRVVAHTTTYYPPINSLIVYGGIVSGVARFSKLSDRMFAFQLDKLHWTEINYPRTSQRDSYIPRERAFHTTSIIGNYLIVFGGYSHKHNREEICYDNHIFLYHLGCNIWVNQDMLGVNNKSKYPKSQGVFSHAAAIRQNHTLLLIGGYHGSVNNDLLAYTLPPMLTIPSSEGFHPEQLCPMHLTQKACISDPECGWCSADSTCYGRTIANCTTNLQTTRCPGLCPALSDCRSCLVHGSPTIEIKNNLSVANKLRLGHCIWCVQNAKCHNRDDNYGCGENYGYEKGWWGSKGTEISQDAIQCTMLDNPPGLTFLKYFYPVDWNYPDHVSTVNSTLVDFNIPITEQSINGEIIGRLIGYVRIPSFWKTSGELLRVCASFSQISLKIGVDNPYIANIFAANLTADLFQCTQSLWQKLENSKILIDLQTVRKIGAVSNINNNWPSKMGLQLNKGSDVTRILTFEYLEPYSNESCQSYRNCLHCLSNNCGWCDLTESCVSRTEAVDNLVCADNNSWKYLILQPHQCTNCSNFISCDECINYGICEWWSEEAKCYRKGRSKIAIKDVNECPTSCHSRKNCSSCLNEKGRCVWCESTSECFSFSIYTSQYQFGLCREWIDKVATSNSSSEDSISSIVNNQQCKTCVNFKNCSSCLRSLNCGWCYYQNNPINGSCVEGDFNTSNSSCSIALDSTIDDTLYSYDQCPDVNECDLKIDDCHDNAICTNTHGSFSCQCKKGFIGDGRHKCDKTCYENCKHGKCSNAPDYVCECNLGWTGMDCSENCGCNNHSTCNERIGKCDNCQSWTYTTGENCENCILGSFGNATKNGCSQCDCNGHGDVLKGICDIKSGQCFCQDNTEGVNCEKCIQQYYGDPRNGGSCFLQCESRAILRNVHRQGIGSYQSAAETRECLWILQLDKEFENSGAIIHLEIEKEHMNVSCNSNAIWIFNGLPEFTNSSQQKQLSNIFCNENNSPWIVEETRTNQLAVYFKQGIKGHGFNAIITIYSCKYRTCYSPYICDTDQRCVCPPGYTGERCSLQVCPNNCFSNLTQGICDEAYGRCICNDGFGDSDCSKKTNINAVILQELFNTQLVSEQFEHLKTQIPRFGHTLVIDRRGSLWMFGGFSLSHGALNDIRQFDTKNNTWMQITVDSTPDAKMPQGRYFHASAIVLSLQTIYTYGGLCLDNRNKTVYFLNDFWEFNIQNQRWKEVEESEEYQGSSPIPLAGHTLTLVKDSEKEALILIGGCSNVSSFELTNGVWLFDLQNKKWDKIATSGPMPTGIFGHSTVYHASSQVLYVFGGYQMDGHKMQVSNKLFVYHYTKLQWSEIPVLTELNRPEENLPRGRFLHSAITTEQYMVIYGGQTQPHNTSDFLNAYIYRCNSWVRLTEDISIVGKIPSPTYGQAMVIDIESGTIYVAGGKDNLNYKITKIKLPADLCSLWSSSKYLCRRMMGCGFCTISTNVSKTLRCFNNEISKTCETNEGSVSVGLGTDCVQYISQRNCTEMRSCTSCLATFFSHSEKNQVCQWCGDEESGKCIEAKHKCGTSKIVGFLNQCSSINCNAFDCNSCVSRGCKWAMVEENYRCVDNETVAYKNLEVMMSCPKKCDKYTDCQTCLNTTSTEGGYMNCLWSTRLNRCISPSYQSLYCAGVICGMVIQPENQDECPQSCESFNQCSKCLQNAHCGWCDINNNGQGICIEGSLDKPDKNSVQPTCKKKYNEAKNITHTDYQFSWHYVNCPPENECANNHHNCNPKSEKCVDLLSGFRCDCSDGYKISSATGKCMPVCQDGCVRGTCLEPNQCQCFFGWVGTNCSIQCNCNGHSNCVGPDKLDECLECQNNTMGSQCEKCKPFFVGDPMNNKNCISCKDYCHGHSDICVAKDIIEEVKNMSRLELETKLTEGPKNDATCLNCRNNTDGNQCDTCLSGFFRGTSTLTTSCRPCECGGHGNLCDAITGEKCNCANNTESDNTCSTKKNSVKNSIYLCWMSQCSKCKESYSGHPKNFGHQCYKHITIDSKFCLDAKPLEECRLRQQILRGGQTAFFVVQPRFMNVDIRIILDVSEGELDFFMSSNDDSFIVLNNRSTYHHEVYLNTKYNWARLSDDLSHVESLNIYPFNVTLNKKSGNIEDNVTMPQSYIDDRYGSGPIDCKNPKEFNVKDLIASDLSTYVTLNQCNTLIRVYKLKNRLVLTLPQNIHNLSAIRFFIAMRAASDVAITNGMIFFRQDQLHIDLFVFFSVFFSCFFLFLAICVVLWKAKQAADMRRARRRHVVEMLHMAQRPFATVILDTTFEDHHSHNRKRSNSSKHRNVQYHSRKNYMPVSFETTADSLAGVCTLFIRLPGKKSNVCLGSALVSMPKNNIFLKPSLRHMQQQQIF